MLVSGWVRAIFIFLTKNIGKRSFRWVRVGSGGFGVVPHLSEVCARFEVGSGNFHIFNKKY